MTSRRKVGLRQGTMVVWNDYRSSVVGTAVIVGLVLAFSVGRISASEPRALPQMSVAQVVGSPLPPAAPSVQPGGAGSDVSPTASPDASAPSAAPAAPAGDDVIVEGAPARTSSLDASCKEILRAGATTLNDVLSAMHSGDGTSQGHDLGNVIVSLRDVQEQSSDAELASLVPPVNDDVAAIRASLLAGQSAYDIKIAPFNADLKKVSDFCSAHLDPLS